MVRTWCQYYTPIPNTEKLFLTWHWKRWGGNNNICANFCHAACSPWPNFFWWGENVVGVTRHCESMGQSKGRRGETACLHRYLMVGVEMCEGNEWRHKFHRNGHDCGHPPISKAEVMVETEALRHDLQVTRGTAGDSTSKNLGSAVSAVALVSVSQAKRFFLCKGKTQQWKWPAIFRIHQQLSGRNSQWVALIGFCGVKTRKQVQKHLKQIEKAYGAMDVRTIVVTAIKEQQIDVDRKFSRVCFGDVVVEDIWKCRFTDGIMLNMKETERVSWFFFSSAGSHRKFGI